MRSLSRDVARLALWRLSQLAALARGSAGSCRSCRCGVRDRLKGRGYTKLVKPHFSINPVDASTGRRYFLAGSNILPPLLIGILCISSGHRSGCDGVDEAKLSTMAADICVAVTKYSHATGVKPDNTIPWTHIVASNIYLVLNGKNSGFQVGDLCLLVVQANTTLVWTC